MKRTYSIIICLTVFLLTFQGYSFAQEQKTNEEARKKMFQPGSNKPKGSVERDVLQFVSIDETNPARRIMTAKNQDGETVYIELPRRIMVRKTVPMSELKPGEEILVSYRKMGGGNVGISVRSGELGIPDKFRKNSEQNKKVKGQ